MLGFHQKVWETFAFAITSKRFQKKSFCHVFFFFSFLAFDLFSYGCI